MRMQARQQSTRAARRLLAAVASVWLIVGVVLAARHEAHVAHVRDRATGGLAHADRLIGHHTGDHSDVHDLATGGNGHDECGICAVAHQAAEAVRPYAAGARASFAETAAASSSTQIIARIGGYRLAPKTSPPTRA
jgi:hypothetical protein